MTAAFLPLRFLPSYLDYPKLQVEYLGRIKHASVSEIQAPPENQIASIIS
jgi:hypothetical protein